MWNLHILQEQDENGNQHSKSSILRLFITPGQRLITTGIWTGQHWNGYGWLSVESHLHEMTLKNIKTLLEMFSLKQTVIVYI